MALSPDSNGKEHPAKVAQSGVHRKTRPASNGRRNPTRGDMFPSHCEPDTRWPRATTLRALPKAEDGLQCEGELCEVRRRLHCYRHLERIAPTRNQTFGRTAYDGTTT